MVDVADLQAALSAYVLADASDSAYVNQCAATALALVTAKIGPAHVPDAIARAAALEVGANLFNRRGSSRDSTNGVDADTTPAFFRPALDPLTPAWPILRPYLEGTGIV